MPAVIALFLRLLGSAIVPLGWKLLRGLGFAAVSYTGLSAAMDQIKSLAISNLSSVPVEVVNVLGLLKIDVCFNIILSALIARTVLRGFSKTGEKKTFRWGG